MVVEGVSARGNPRGEGAKKGFCVGSERGKTVR